MKHAIICTKGKRKWVCAICDTHKQTEVYLRRISQDIKTEVVIFNANKYPVYIIEDDKGFSFTSEIRVVEKKMKAIEIIEDFDDCYFTYYIIEKQFTTRPYGEDRMGALDHIHVDNHSIQTLHSL